MTKRVTQVTFTTRVSVTYAALTPKAAAYLKEDHLLAKAVAVSLYPVVYDVSTMAHYLTGAKQSSKRVSGTRFHESDLLTAHPVTPGSNGTNIALKGSFVVKEGLSEALLRLMQHQEEADALVKECFLKLPAFATPRREIFHNRPEDYSRPEIAAMFTQVDVTETAFTHEDILRPQAMAIYNHPKLQEWA